MGPCATGSQPTNFSHRHASICAPLLRVAFGLRPSVCHFPAPTAVREMWPAHNRPSLAVFGAWAIVPGARWQVILGCHGKASQLLARPHWTNKIGAYVLWRALEQTAGTAARQLVEIASASPAQLRLKAAAILAVSCID